MQNRVYTLIIILSLVSASFGSLAKADPKLRGLIGGQGGFGGGGGNGGFGNGNGGGFGNGNGNGNGFGGNRGGGGGGSGGGGGGFGGGGGGGGQAGGQDPLKDAVGQSVKDGDAIRKQIETNGKAGTDAISKAMDNFSQNIASVNKVTEGEDLQSGFKQLQSMISSIGAGGDANGSAVEMIVNSYKNISQLHSVIQQTAAAGAQSALNFQSQGSDGAGGNASAAGPELANANSAQGDRRLADGLATAQNASVKNAITIPQIPGGTGYGAPPPADNPALAYGNRSGHRKN